MEMTMSKKLEGKVALVTGASKGIGAGIALRLASEGAAVAVNYNSSKAEADRVVAKIKEGGGRAIAIRANVAKPDEARHWSLRRQRSSVRSTSSSTTRA
jgi:3-oxoacyl-[acyl-carrier protein] reductase